jgi:hypothetical protein
MYRSDTQEYYSVVTCNICCVVLWWKCKYSYTYDAIGNPTTYRGASLAFNGRQLTSYNDGTNSVAYTYYTDGGVDVLVETMGSWDLMTSIRIGWVTSSYVVSDLVDAAKEIFQ